MTDHFGGTTTYAYYDNGLLHELTDRASGLTHYEYWDNGLLKKMTYPNGTYAEYTYHAQRNWLVSLNHWKAGGTILIAGFTYEYDPTYWGKNGTRTAMTENILLPQEQSRIESTVEYTYDNVYRLTGEERTGSLSYTKSYTYDDIGNRLTKVEGSTTTYYHYDYQYSSEHGQKLRDYGPWDIPGDTRNTRLSYDNFGNTTVETPPSGPVTNYAYDYQNFMTMVTVGGVTTAQFAYDGDGLRRSVVTGTTTTFFLYEATNLIEELDGVGALKAVYTMGSDGIVSRQGETMLYYHPDGLNITKSITNMAPIPAVTDVYEYDAWGDDPVHYGNIDQPYQYVGRLGYYTHSQDASLGILKLGARYYQPRLGRFVSADPAYQGNNRYVYAGDAPTVFVDPTGLWYGSPWYSCKPVGPCRITQRGLFPVAEYILPIPFPVWGRHAPPPPIVIPIFRLHVLVYEDKGLQVEECTYYDKYCPLIMDTIFEERPCKRKRYEFYWDREDWQFPSDEWLDRLPI